MADTPQQNGTGDEQILDLSVRSKLVQVRFEAEGPLYDMVDARKLPTASRVELAATDAALEKLQSKTKAAQNAPKIRELLVRAAELIVPAAGRELLERQDDMALEAITVRFWREFGVAMRDLMTASVGEDALAMTAEEANG